MKKMKWAVQHSTRRPVFWFRRTELGEEYWAAYQKVKVYDELPSELCALIIMNGSKVQKGVVTREPHHPWYEVPKR